MIHSYWLNVNSADTHNIFRDKTQFIYNVKIFLYTINYLSLQGTEFITQR